MSGAIPPLLQYSFMAWCLVKAQGQLYLYLYSNSDINGTRTSVYVMHRNLAAKREIPLQLYLLQDN
jgi:hypothetical protein